jgi:RecA-family ATPase
MNEIIDFALGRGLRVFPCNPANKRPIIRDWQSRATTDQTMIQQWLDSFPQAMYGTPTGDSLWVLDIDAKNGGLLWLSENRSRLPSTLQVSTPSGGFHFYFKGNVRNSVSKIAPGVDTRGVGGYVVLPFSERADGAFYDLVDDQPIAEPGEWLNALVLGVNLDPAAVRLAHDPEARAISGTRNSALASLAGRYRAVGLSADEMLPLLLDVNARRCDPPLDEEEVAAIARSVSRYEPDPQAVAAVETVASGVAPDVAPPAVNFAAALANLTSGGVTTPQSEEPEPTSSGLTPIEELPIEDEEWALATLAPRCIVENYLYADVAQLVAPGGVGKTTLILYEAVMIALGRPLWGLEVSAPGQTIILTKEDSRERLVARLREICRALDLSPAEIATVRRSVLIEDLTGRVNMRFAWADPNTRQVVSTGAADLILATYCERTLPAQIVVDPMVSFGAGEANVNDNEQAIIETARKIIRQSPTCVRFIHHTGKTNARTQTLDQYSGRGGSAMADGSRMTTVLAEHDPETSKYPIPMEWAGIIESERGQALIHNRAKLQYAPKQPVLLLLRQGWGYGYREFSADDSDDYQDRQQVLSDALYAWVNAFLKTGGVGPTETEAKSAMRSGFNPAIGKVTVAEVNTVLAELKARGHLVLRDGRLLTNAR